MTNCIKRFRYIQKNYTNKLSHTKCPNSEAEVSVLSDKVGSWIGKGRENRSGQDGKIASCCRIHFSRSLLETGSNEIGQ